MIEVYYCVPSEFSSLAMATGSQRFHNRQEIADWLCEQRLWPVIIIAIVER